jgi:myo-inositol-1(or 4)-monophosphatase
MSYSLNLKEIRGQAALALLEIGKELVHAVSSNQVGAASFKSGTEIFTQLDLWAEQELKSRLQRILPGSHFIGEEGQCASSPSELCRRLSEESPLWVVDPIDGTNNFCNLIPHFAISVALVNEGRVVLGMIYDPNRDELYHAEKGKGAFRNGLPINPSATDSLANSLVSFYFPIEGGRLAPFWTQIEKAVVRARASRSHGCATLDLCWVACGRMELALMTTLQLWDLAAGYLIASEAGVKICNYPEVDSEFNFFERHFVFAAPAIWQEVKQSVLGHPLMA